MELFDTILGKREFLGAEEIAAYIVNSKNFNAAIEDPAQAETMRFFETSKQHTWLVGTPNRLYCILDDIRKPTPHINWSMSKLKIIEGPELVVDLVSRTRNKSTGTIDFGPKHKRWLYSRSLFEDQPVEDAVEGFINGVMKGG